MPSKPPIQQRLGARSKQQRKQERDRRRDQRHEYRAWYKTSRWRAIAKHQLAIEPLCATCLAAGRITAATVCDHVEPHRGDADKFWNGPFQSLCDEAPWRCHSRVKQLEERMNGS